MSLKHYKNKFTLNLIYLEMFSINNFYSLQSSQTEIFQTTGCELQIPVTTEFGKQESTVYLLNRRQLLQNCGFVLTKTLKITRKSILKTFILVEQYRMTQAKVHIHQYDRNIYLELEDGHCILALTKVLKSNTIFTMSRN